jgi:hypothetical protein
MGHMGAIWPSIGQPVAIWGAIWPQFCNATSAVAHMVQIMILRAKLFSSGVVIHIVIANTYDALFAALGQLDSTAYDDIVVIERTANSKIVKAAGMDWILLG